MHTKRMYSTATAQPKFKAQGVAHLLLRLSLGEQLLEASFTQWDGDRRERGNEEKDYARTQGSKESQQEERLQGSNLCHKARSKEWATRT